MVDVQSAYRRDVAALLAPFDRVKVNRSRWAHLLAPGPFAALTLCNYVTKGQRAHPSVKVCPRCKGVVIRADDLRRSAVVGLRRSFGAA